MGGQEQEQPLCPKFKKLNIRLYLSWTMKHIIYIKSPKNAALFGSSSQLSSFSPLCRSLSLKMWLVPLRSCHYDSDGNNLRRLDERKRRTILRSRQKGPPGDCRQSPRVLFLLLITCSEACGSRGSGTIPYVGSPWGFQFDNKAGFGTARYPIIHFTSASKMH